VVVNAWTQQAQRRDESEVAVGSRLGVASVAKFDAVVENFRPGQLAQMGLGPEQLRAVRRILVIAHISGFGSGWPVQERAAFWCDW